MRNNPCIIFGLPLISLTYQHDTGRNDYTADSFHIWVIWIYTPFYVDVSLQRIMTVMKRCNGQHMSVWFNMTIQLFHFISSIFLFDIRWWYNFLQFCLFFGRFFISVLLELLDQYLLGGVEPNREDLDHVFLRFGRKRWTKSFIWLLLLFPCFVCNKLIYFLRIFPFLSWHENLL